jgi:hypothetical protein
MGPVKLWHHVRFLVSAAVVLVLVLDSMGYLERQFQSVEEA